ncbi:MAG TPA: hypothetical protein DDW52_12360 [Planctomycetaceae bacterium]|nr:hypothetical protein [Planctomycetaceae bacterium]
MKQWIVNSAFLICLWGNHFAVAQDVVIKEGSYEGRPQYVVTTPTASWWFDRAGGGFSRLIDDEGRDWISFHKEPLSKFPDSAAAGYRGLPNCVFVGPDKGAGHPGFDRCESKLVGANQIVTMSKSGDWQWRWTFYPSFAEFEMLKAGKDPWWFLYEGPVGGRYAPKVSYWATDTESAPQRTIPDNSSQRFGLWQTFYAGADGCSNAIVVHQVQRDQLQDTVWYLGSSDRGAASSENGMIVFGFGRGKGTKPLLTGKGQQFRVALIDIPPDQPPTPKQIQAVARSFDPTKE